MNYTIHPSTDHDLLITLHTKFDLLMPRIEEIFRKLDSKASKDDIADVLKLVKQNTENIASNLEAIRLLEERNKSEDDRKDGIWAVIKGSWKVWLGITGIVLFVFQFLNNT